MNCKICDKSFTGLACFQQHEASEKHKNKVKLYQDATANGTFQNTSTDNDLLIIPCTVCEIQLKGLINFQAHVNSLQHADMIRKKSDGNIVPNSQSGPRNNPNSPEITEVSNCSNPSYNIPFNLTNAALGSYAQCEICHKEFSGPAPYQQHIVSEAHKKKCIQRELNPENQLKSTCNKPSVSEAKTEINSGLNVPLCIPNAALGSYAHCEVCQKQFSGPAPYQQHIVSEAHKKKCIQRGLSPENQLKNTSNEPSISEADTEINSSLNVPLFIPNAALGSFAECDVCQKQFSGRASYEQHIVSELHKKKVIQKELSSSKLSFDTVDSDKIMPFVNHREKVYKNDTSGTAHPFAECKFCNMTFTGLEPYRLHLDSAGHQKKIAVEQNQSIQDPKNTNGVVSSLKCDICNKDFTGPVPYNDHLESKGHKSKVHSVDFFKAITSSVYPEPDSSTPSSDYIKENVKIAAKSSGHEWYCEVCKVQTTGREPYRQHIYGELHRKNNNSQKELSKDDRFKSNLFNNEDKKDFRISNDLILCDALKNIGVVRPEDLNIAIFYPDDEIVFDDTTKKNNYNDKIIFELNCE